MGAANAFYVFSEWSEIRPKLSHYKQRLMETDRTLARALDDIAAHVQSKYFSNESEKLDYIRNWVNQNSVHKIDEQHKDYAHKTHVTVPMLWRHHLLRDEAPHLACGSRAYAMKLILGRLGIKSRVIDIFTKAGKVRPGVEGHTFLEVWNRETHTWEIQDPDLNVSFQHAVSRKRVSVFQMVMGNIDEVEPINSKGPMQWVSDRGLYNVAVYRLHYEGDRSVVIMNSSSATRARRHGGGEANSEFIEYLKRTYYDPIIFDGTGSGRP